MSILRVCQNPVCAKSFLAVHERIKYCSRRCYASMRPQHPLEIRFWAKVRMCIHGPYCPYCCWEWTGGHKGRGYGIITIREGTRYISRPTHAMMWELVNGRTIPEGLQANHHCDNPSCCSIWHVYIGTQEENMQDARTRKRFAYGEIRSDLENETVLSMKELYRAGMSASAIAKQCKTGVTNVRLILYGQRWKHLAAALSPEEIVMLGKAHQSWRKNRH